MAKKQASLADFEISDSDSIFDDETAEETEEQDSQKDSDEDQDEEEEKPKNVKTAKKEKQTSTEDTKKEKKSSKSSKQVEEELETDDEIKTTDDSEEETTSETDSEKFFEEVEKITGQQVDVEYGDVDPISPQGVALREKAVKEQALDNFLTEIEEKFPQAFKALQHAYNGGDISELFTQTTGRDYSKVNIGEDDTVLAKEILKDYYKSKGIKNETKINKFIEIAEESEEGLITEAEGLLEELKESQDEQRSEVLENQKAKAAEQKKRDQILVTAVDDVLETRNLAGFRITDRAEASEFKKYVLGNIRRTDNGRYELATVIDQSNMEKILQAQYFQFKKGDLSKMILQKATTENTNKLKLRLKGEQNRIRSSQETTTSSGSLKDFDA